MTENERNLIMELNERVKFETVEEKKKEKIIKKQTIWPGREGKVGYEVVRERNEREGLK